MSNGQTYQQRFSDIDCVINDSEITSFFEGEDVIHIEQTEDQFSDVIGEDGDMIVSASSNESGTVKLKLMPESAGNSVMMGLYNNQKQSGASIGRFSLTVRNKNGKEGSACEGGYIPKAPPLTFGGKPTVREWIVKFRRVSFEA